MENGQNADVSSWDLALVPSVDQNYEVRNQQDVLVRRMKNRERQRRYRARKRLEAEKKKTIDSQLLPYPEGDTTKAITYIPPLSTKDIKNVVSRTKETTVDHFTPVRIEIPLNNTSVEFVSKVHSHRDWKRDARRSHTFKGQEVIPLATSAGGNQTQPSSLGVNNVLLDSGCLLSGPILNNNQEPTVTPSRRHWKEEARNKKS